jgi:hypothetical protein
MIWIKDEEDYFHNLDDYSQINVVYDEDFRGDKKYSIRAFAKNKGYVDLYYFETLEEAKLLLKNLMLRFI